MGVIGQSLHFLERRPILQSSRNPCPLEGMATDGCWRPAWQAWRFPRGAEAQVSNYNRLGSRIALSMTYARRLFYPPLGVLIPPRILCLPWLISQVAWRG
jgi:hypothetical protein